MGDSPGHLGIADLPAPVRLAQLSRSRANHATRLSSSKSGPYLLAETIGLTTAVILGIRILNESPLANALWLITPALLVAAALVPTIVRRARFAEIGLNLSQIKLALPLLCRTCLVVFPATFAGLWLLNSRGLESPLLPILPENQHWLCWVCYQFLYVAVAEEVFFRGYLLSNILRLTSAIKCRPGLRNWASIVLSAACFAAAHIIIQGQIIAVLTFLPGLVLAYLFVRTKSLLAPILFHGLANTCYCIMAAVCFAA